MWLINQIMDAESSRQGSTFFAQSLCYFDWHSTEHCWCDCSRFARPARYGDHSPVFVKRPPQAHVTCASKEFLNGQRSMQSRCEWNRKGIPDGRLERAKRSMTVTLAVLAVAFR